MKIEEIGRGGTGRIFKAYCPDLDRWVTLKFLLPAFSSDPLHRVRFRDEAALLSSLSHPNIVRYVAYGMVKWTEPLDSDRNRSGKLVKPMPLEGGIPPSPGAGEEPALILEFVNGTNLLEWRRKRPLLKTDRIVSLGTELCEAVGFLHHRRILHGDLNPSNILLSSEEQLYVTDFGNSVRDGPETVTAPVIAPDATLQYASPEQLKGEILDQRSDIFSLGMVLHWLISGEGHFTGKGKSQIWQELVHDPAPLQLAFPDSTPVILQELVRKMTAKARSGRYPDIENLLRQFSRIKKGEIVPASARERRGAGRQIIEPAIILAAGFAVVLSITFFGPRESSRSQPLLPPEPGEIAMVNSRTREAGKMSERGGPLIDLAHLTRENGRTRKEGIPSDPFRLTDAELERFLLSFKTDLETGNMKGLQEAIFVPRESVSFLERLFKEASRPEVEFLRIEFLGQSVSVVSGIRSGRDGSSREGLLVFRNGYWNLNFP